jgi:hypothetical protein
MKDSAERGTARTLATSSPRLHLRLTRRDQATRGRSREPLDAGLLAKRGASIGDLDHERELNRTRLRVYWLAKPERCAPRHRCMSVVQPQYGLLSAQHSR